MTVWIYLGIGVVIGGCLGWLLGTRQTRLSPEQQRLEEELRRQIAQSQAELHNERKSAENANTDAAAAKASRAAVESELATTRQELVTARSAEETARRRTSEVERELATAQANLEAAQRRFLDQQTRHEADIKDMRDDHQRALNDLREAFKALSADALRQVQPEFLRLANETFAKFTESAKGDLSQRQQSIATLLKPLEEQLQTYQQRLQQAETSQSTLLGEVRKQLEGLSQQSQSLSGETLQLRRVLSSNQARGRWGEETLRRVVEAAGMSAHCDFTEQAQMDDSKPDLLIHLPGDRLIIVDAKVPDLGFLSELNEAESEHSPSRAEKFREHATKLRSTIKSLADREYPAKFTNALDFVVLFLPAESLFSAALEADRELMVWAQNRKILLATPTSLMAILRSVSVSWQHYSQTQNARKIADAAQELYGRVCKFTEHFERIRDGITKATDAYNSAVGTYDRQIRPSAERLAELGGGIEGRLPAEIPPLETALRNAPLPSTKTEVA